MVYMHTPKVSPCWHTIRTNQIEGQINKGMAMEACLFSILSMEGEKQDLLRPGTFVAVVA
jgi:hypothetical protein